MAADSPSTASIRKITEKDFSAIRSILESTHQNKPGLLGARWSDEQLREEIAQGGWILERQSSSRIETEAFILTRELPDATEITMLATTPGQQRRGFMRSLFTHFISQLPADRALWLEVHEANHPAQCFYKTHGFQLTGRRPKYYSDGAAALLFSRP